MKFGSSIYSSVWRNSTPQMAPFLLRFFFGILWYPQKEGVCSECIIWYVLILITKGPLKTSLHLTQDPTQPKWIQSNPIHPNRPTQKTQNPTAAPVCPTGSFQDLKLQRSPSLRWTWGSGHSGRNRLGDSDGLAKGHKGTHHSKLLPLLMASLESPWTCFGFEVFFSY